MNGANFPYRLYLVTDEAACLGRNLITVVEEAVKGGVDIVQIREKNLSDMEFLNKAMRLKEMLDRYHVPLIVNDNLAIACASGAAGIHVGDTDISPIVIREHWGNWNLLGYSLENREQLQSREAALSDYLALSPVFATPTKTNTKIIWGVEGISTIRTLTTKPLVAIGGVKKENAAEIIRAGADCLAVVTAICSAPYPGQAAESIRTEIEKALIKQ